MRRKKTSNSILYFIIQHFYSLKTSNVFTRYFAEPVPGQFGNSMYVIMSFSKSVCLTS